MRSEEERRKERRLLLFAADSSLMIDGKGEDLLKTPVQHANSRVELVSRTYHSEGEARCST